MPVKIRVDDFIYTKEDEHRSGKHTVDNFMKFHEVIPVRYLLGIIPTTLPPDREFSGLNVEPGLHGLSHPEHKRDEFGGVPSPKIQDAIVKGVGILQEHGFSRPRIYMPPHNVFDLRMPVVLKQVGGFTAMTGGPETDPISVSWVGKMGMEYIPSMPPFEYGRSDELLERGALNHLHTLHAEGRTCVLGLHWTWEWNIGLTNLKVFIEQLSDILEDF